MIFPGSAMFAKSAENRRGPQPKPAVKDSVNNSQPLWIVAGEVVETSRLFLRTVAEIDPLWIVELAPHLIRRSFVDAHWAPNKGNVMALERVLLNGLVVLERMVPYGKVNPKEATDIFIRNALVEEGLADHFHRPGPARNASSTDDDAATDGKRDVSRLPAIYGFLQHNRQLREKIELWQTRLPHRVASDLDESVYQAYAKQLENVSSIPELNRFLHDSCPSNPKCLHISAADLLGNYEQAFNGNQFPDTVAVGSQNVPLSYAYAPGEDRDGVTIQLPFTLAQVIDPAALDWGRARITRAADIASTPVAAQSNPPHIDASATQSQRNGAGVSADRDRFPARPRRAYPPGIRRGNSTCRMEYQHPASAFAPSIRSAGSR